MIFKQPKVQFMINIMLVAYLFLNLIHYVFDIAYPFNYILLLLINGIGLISFICFFVIMKNAKLTIYTVLMFVGGISSYFFAKNINIMEFFLFLRYLGIALLLVNVELDKRIMNIMMIISLVFFVPVFTNIAGYNIFTKASQNYHSIILMTHNFAYNLTYWEKKERASAIPTLLCFFISVFSGGRGPILSYALFLLGTLLINRKIVKEEILKNQQLRIHRGVEIILALLLIVLSIQKYNMYLDERKHFEEHGPTKETEIIAKQRSGDNKLFFSTQGVKSSARMNIIKHYFKSAFNSPKQLIFGVTVSSVEYFSRYKFNLHNSYLKLHAKFGLIGAIITAYFVIRSLYLLIKTKNIGMTIVFLGVLFRMLTDSSAFPGHLDIVIYYLIFGLPNYMRLDNKSA